ncbi:IclR family transcriptional regulator domain-containing protein [Nesterenkonia flava]|uniref:IclR family transcriptional regulator C-terminal domain-containing protein n=1 Tax=Nesterenkonia flava TaxID=469799 RepID=A0ABU1FPL1_9MICC|nr:IclR family transcriptional regulator C-terminal domain-containing protein [Nesterenkonia flava]MDR5710577.1 IclR family transcriptional regulator C-terminal domain-containing protein [Nesterenkonia flava]
MSTGDYVQSLARGLEVIRAFTEEPEGEPQHLRMALSLTEIAERTGLSRATARRFLLTLADLGYVSQRGRTFELTPKVLELGYSYFASADLPQLIQPVLEDVSTKLGESVSASVLDGAEIVYIARAHIRRIMRINIAVGTRLPAYATSMGRVHLAHVGPDEVLTRLKLPLKALTPHTVTDLDELFAQLEATRIHGWSLVEHELEVGLRSVAVPVFAPGGEVVAAMNVALGMTNGLDSSPAELEQRFVRPLQHEAERIQAALRQQR